MQELAVIENKRGEELLSCWNFFDFNESRATPN